MKSGLLLLVLSLVCISSGSPPNVEQHAVALRQRREVEIVGNSRKLIEELLLNLQKAAQQAADAIVTFTKGLQSQAQLFAEKLASDLQSLRNRVSEAILNITNKFTGAGAAVKACIDARKTEAEELFKDTAARSKSCADQRIKEINDMVLHLQDLSNKALEFSKHAMDELNTCTQVNSGNILGTGTCLGSVAIQSEMKGAAFLAQSGFSITRINLAIATLPAALEVCAGSQLVSAGVGTAKIVMEVGSCSASSIFQSLT